MMLVIFFPFPLIFILNLELITIYLMILYIITYSTCMFEGICFISLTVSLSFCWHNFYFYSQRFHKKKLHKHTLVRKRAYYCVCYTHFHYIKHFRSTLFNKNNNAMDMICSESNVLYKAF